MFRRYWLPAIALGLILSAAQGAPVKNAARPHSDAAQAQTQPVSGAPPVARTAIDHNADRIAKALEAQNAREGSKEEDQRARDNLQAQQKMANAAASTVVVAAIEASLTLIGICLVGWTLYHTKRAADAAHEAVKETRSIGQAQVRAYLSCVGAHYEIFEGNIMFFVPRFKNTGASPASEIVVTGQVCVILDDEPCYSDVHSDSALPIASGEVGDCRMPYGGTEDPIKPHIGKNRDWEVTGTCYWTDVFGERQSIDFSLIGDGDEIDTMFAHIPIRRREMKLVRHDIGFDDCDE